MALLCAVEFASFISVKNLTYFETLWKNVLKVFYIHDEGFDSNALTTTICWECEGKDDLMQKVRPKRAKVSLLQSPTPFIQSQPSNLPQIIFPMKEINKQKMLIFYNIYIYFLISC